MKETLPPPWFREVVFNSLLAASAQLLPTPFVDDILENRVRRRMSERLAATYGTTLSDRQARRLAGEASGWTLGRIAGKAILYPIKKIIRKVVYVLAVKKALDTASDVFHRGYLLRSALERRALSGATLSDDRVDEVAGALEQVLSEVDTAPIGNTIKGVFRSSWRLVRKTVAWMATRLVGSQDLDDLEATGASREELEREAPQTEELLDRLLLVLWGRDEHLAALDRRLASALGEAAGPAAPHS
jgi:hypothetical protein